MSQLVNAKKIGEGGFGVIAALSDYKVAKLFKDIKVCGDAMTEANKQKRIQRAIMQLKKGEGPFLSLRRKLSSSSIYRTLKDYLIVPNVTEFLNEPIFSGEVLYECVVVMDRLFGIPATTIEELRKGALHNVEKDFLSANSGWSPLVHLSLNQQVPEGFYGARPDAQISDENAPRGYFVTIDDENSLIDVLRSQRAPLVGLPVLQLSNSDITSMIGFIYSFLFYCLHTMPIDLEITLVVEKGRYKIAMLDFGMAIDLSDPDALEQMKRNNKYKKYEILLQDSMSAAQKFSKLRKELMDDLSMDLYASLYDNEKDEEFSGLNGWMVLENTVGVLNAEFLDLDIFNLDRKSLSE